MKLWSFFLFAFLFFNQARSTFLNDMTKGTMSHNTHGNADLEKLMIPESSNEVAKPIVLAEGKRSIATFVGYFIGAGAIALYLPIILDILKSKNVEGVSVATWVTALASFSLALIYPLKKRFAFSTYIELVALHIQSFIILGIICTYKLMLKEFIMGSILLGSVIAVVLVSNIPPSILSSIQIVRVILDAYSLIPQIVVNYNNKMFSYNEITAMLSVIGNGLRVFTTLKLVKDPLVLAGYVIGVASNLILLLQFVMYKKM